MNDSLSHEFRYLVLVWLVSALLPCTALLWRTEDGLILALGLFFVGSASLVAYSFRRELSPAANSESELPQQIGRTRMVAVVIALLAAWAVFSSVHLALNGGADFVSVVQALSALIPSCCIVPYFTRVTRKPFAAVVFAVFLVASMKLLGCVVVVAVHGWDASERGYTTMPWANPNLLVWLFWVNTAVLSLVCAFLGIRKFRQQAAYLTGPSAALDCDGR